MTRSKGKAKFIGSCGIYVFAQGPHSGSSGDADEAADVASRLLVHRRSKQVSESHTIASPGGIVERRFCQLPSTWGGQWGSSSEIDFDRGARATAVQELLEETGIELDDATVSGLSELPVGEDAWWGPQMHRNYCVQFDKYPPVRGPEKASLHEVQRGGMDGIGEPAGDGFHAWVDIRELLRRDDLMKGCRGPLVHYATQVLGLNLEEEEDDDDEPCGSSAVGSVKRALPRTGATASVGSGKRARGSIARELDGA